MILNNPIFSSWYTDTVDVWRVVSGAEGNVDSPKREQVGTAILCRVYSSQKSGPAIQDTAARVQSTDKLACDLGTDIRAGDELLITRGGALGMKNEPERYIAGDPQQYYDPAGGAMTGLNHMEVGLLKQNIVE